MAMINNDIVHRLNFVSFLPLAKHAFVITKNYIFLLYLQQQKLHSLRTESEILNLNKKNINWEQDLVT